MEETTRNCPRCQRVVLEYHFGGASECPVCVAGQQKRPDPTPGRWEPSNIAALGIVFNPMLITTIMAVGRAREWLKYAAARDAAGEYSPWHAYIRSNAIWALVISAFQPMMAFFLFSMVFFVVDIDMPKDEPLDERAEVLALLEHERAAVRSIGLCQLAEIGARTQDTATVSNAMRRELTDVGIACGEIAYSHASGTPMTERYAQQPVAVRNELLTRFADRGETQTAAQLLRMEHDLSPPATTGILGFSHTTAPAVIHALVALVGHDNTRPVAHHTLNRICAVHEDVGPTVHAAARIESVDLVPNTVCLP